MARRSPNFYKRKEKAIMGRNKKFNNICDQQLEIEKLIKLVNPGITFKVCGSKFVLNDNGEYLTYSEAMEEIRGVK